MLILWKPNEYWNKQIIINTELGFPSFNNNYEGFSLGTFLVSLCLEHIRPTVIFYANYSWIKRSWMSYIVAYI